jgi:hypothetical protein
MVEIFKTNVQEVNDANAIIQKLLEHFPSAKINFDLEDCDNILRIDTLTKITESAIELMQNKGFNCEELTD